MKKIILGMVLMAVATSSYAAMAFFKYETEGTMNKICVYDHLGDDVAITIKAYKLCPLTINI